MNRLKMEQVRCEALFASGLQRSDALTADTLTEVISRTVQQHGIGGCAGMMAQEFGDHPEAAAERRLVQPSPVLGIRRSAYWNRVSL
jgi:hypothetical protein